MSSDADVMCLCGDLGRQHRTGIRRGQVVRTSCKGCGCDRFEPDEAPQTIEAQPTRPPSTPQPPADMRLCHRCGQIRPAGSPRLVEGRDGWRCRDAGACAARRRQSAAGRPAPSGDVLDLVATSVRAELRPLADAVQALAGALPARPAGLPADGVIDRWDAWWCPVCGSRPGHHQDDHGCGPLYPITVTITARDEGR